MFCFSGNPNNALYVLELAGARALAVLADLMTIQYSVKWQISADPKTWYVNEIIMKKERNCTCLYFLMTFNIFLWIRKTSGVIHFRKIGVDENIVGAELLGGLDEFFQ